MKFLTQKYHISYFLSSLFLFLSTVHAIPASIKGVAIINAPTVFSNETNNATSGVLYDIFNKICSQLNITVYYDWTIDIMQTNRSLLSLVANGTYDFILGFPILPNEDDFGEEFENLSKMSLLRDSIIIFTPNLLQLLVVGVLKELFFVFVIIFVPWILIATSLYYLIEIRRFSNMRFFKGFSEAFFMVTYRKKKMPKGAKIYSAFFYITTIIISMLLLGDFIYVIASMLLKSDIDNINDSVNRRSSVCILQNDYLTRTFLRNRPEIRYSQTLDPVTCFIELNSFNVGSFLISGSRIKNFFHGTPSQNNMFDFDVRDSVSLDYYVLLRNDLDHLHSKMAPIYEELEIAYIPSIINKYETQPIFNRIVPSSIFSDSILLIFTSLTITSSFLIIFLIISIYQQRKDRSSSDDKYNKKKRRKYMLARQNDRYSQQQILEMEDYSDHRGDDVRYRYQPNYPQHVPPSQNYNTYNNYNPRYIPRNGTLSLSGPVHVNNFDGKPEKSWLKIDHQSSKAEGSIKLQGTSDFENQISPIPKVEDMESRQITIDIDSREKNNHGGVGSKIEFDEEDERKNEGEGKRNPVQMKKDV